MYEERRLLIGAIGGCDNGVVVSVSFMKIFAIYKMGVSNFND